ncbi:MAG: hypothetical protein E7033_02665 [Akkermansiaceae bacterium]|nr:hypothetical protein [Akkermansiaceae bacterium]
MKRLCISFLAIGILACPACRQTPPPIGYAESAPIVAKRTELAQHLLQLLPQEQQQLPQAQAEARLLADTAYKASAAIGRINNPKRWPAWRNNHLVNSYGPDSLERGLCWHYQHDLFRELRRFPLTYFRVGCCVRNREDADHEHNGVYITPASAAWPHCIILDAWKKAGRLLTLYPDDFLHDAWQDRPETTAWLEEVYPVGHPYPIEHWASVRSDTHWNTHHASFSPEGKASAQGKRMYANMQRGLKERNGNPINY